MICKRGKAGESLAAFANARVLLAAGMSRLASQRNLFRSKQSLNGTANMRHDLRNAGRCGIATSRNANPKAAKGARTPPRAPRRKEADSRNTRPNGPRREPGPSPHAHKERRQEEGEWK